jgi:hypothetical protein
MSHFTLTPSPLPEVTLVRFDPDRYPKFRPIFETQPPDSRLSHFTCDPEESNYALVLENHSAKAITALRYRWIAAKQDGQVRPHVMSSDSYGVDVFRPVLTPGNRKLISPSTNLDESLLDHVLAGAGFLGSGSGVGRAAKRSMLDDAADLAFSLDFILFDDGEIAGPDPDKYASDLQCRKPAAEFIAKQIRLAAAEHRDVSPVLSALADLPRRRDDHFGLCINDYARDYLRALQHRALHDQLSGFDMPAARLRHLENRPTLPRFYRR